MMTPISYFSLAIFLDGSVTLSTHENLAFMARAFLRIAALETLAVE
jgi:hypothetical protein